MTGVQTCALPISIHPDNQRITQIDLTDKGREELDQILEHRSQRFQALFKAIQVTPEEKEVLIRICQRGVAFFDTILGFGQTVKK